MDELSLLQKKLDRERKARLEAERLLEVKALELYLANERLKSVNTDLERQIQESEQELKDQQKRYQILVQLAEDVIYWVTPTGYISSVNPMASRLLACEDSQIIGRHFTDFIPEKEKQQVSEFYTEQIRNKVRTTYFEFPILSAVGQKIWLGQRATLVFQDDTVKEINVIARDITSRRKFEKELNLLNTRFKTLLESLQIGILLEDENRNIVLVNRRFCEMFNVKMSAEELIGMNCDTFAKLFQRYFKQPDDFFAGIEELIQKRVTSTNIELETVDGKIYNRNFVPIYAEENYLGHLWYYEDISARKNTENLIRRSEEKYRGIIENMELGLFEVDPQGIITRAYDHLCRTTGYTEEELIGKSAVQIFVPPEHYGVLQKQAENRSKGIPGVYELEIMLKDGSRRWVLTSGAPFFDEMGTLAGNIAIHYDITQQKKMQIDLELARLEAEKARDAEKEFLANMSHEIRNPINTIIGMTYLLMDTAISEEQKKYLQNIKHTSDILLALVSDILDITKITEGKMELAPREFNLGELLTATSQIVAFRINEKGVAFQLDVDESLHVPVLGDPTFVNQVLLNLLGNSSKFTEEGYVRLTARKKEETDHELLLEVAIEDTGIGIPQDKLPHIFERFRQAGKATKQQYGGTGLGLNIARRLIELHGGKIQVHSSVNIGSTFTFSMTFEKVKQSKEFSPKLIEMSKPTQTQFHLLIVEDNELNQQYIERLLNKNGYSSRLAAHGKEALVWLEKEKFDLILMDIRMPEMDGYETTIRLRNMTHNPNHIIPIIALTASALLDEKERALSVGMNYHLTKPFTPSQLFQILDMAIQEFIAANTPEPEGDLHPAISRDLIEEMYAGDMEHFKMMLELFVESIPPELELLDQAIASGDREKSYSVAHKIKPSFSMAGLINIVDKIKSLEQLLRETETAEEGFALYREMKPLIEEGMQAAHHQLHVFGNNTSVLHQS